MSRLPTIAADLAEQLNNCSANQLRKVASAAALLAVDRTNLVDPRLDGALATIRDSARGDRSECSNALRVTEELDERAWDIREKVDDGTLPKHACLEAFRKARAAASVGFALEPNPLQAALEAVHEARAAAADLEAVRAAIDSVLMD